MRYCLLRLLFTLFIGQYPLAVGAVAGPGGSTQFTTGNAKLSIPVPNPASGEVKIDYSAGGASRSTLLRIYNFLGKPVKTIQLATAVGSVQVDINSLQPGIYFCSLEVEGKIVSTKRMVISR